MATKKVTAKKTPRKTATRKVVPKTMPKTANVLEALVYSTDGTSSGKVSLPESVFGARFNADLVHQVVVGMQANARTPIAHSKDRSEVRGGGKKPWRQKGTGRARHGSNRSPIWIGGGVTHGPRNEKDYSKKINRKMRTKALYVILSKKLKDGEIMFVDNLSLNAPKTKDAKTIITALSNVKGFEALGIKKRNNALIALSGYDATVARSFRNFGNMLVDEVRNINPAIALKYKHLIIVDPKVAIDFLENKQKTTQK